MNQSQNWFPSGTNKPRVPHEWLQRARASFPPVWRRFHLKRLLGSHRDQVDDLLNRWHYAGHIEEIAESPGFYRFLPSTPLSAAETPVSPLRIRASPWLWLSDLAADHSLRILTGGTLVLFVFALLFVAQGFFFPPEVAVRGTAATPAEQFTHQLHHPATAWYAPSTDGPSFGVVPPGTLYTPLARYGETWVQLEFADLGTLWVHVAEVAGIRLAILPDLLPAPTPVPVVGYSGHIVREGETLDMIAERGGSSTSIISNYNRLYHDPPPGRPLIIPRLAGYVSNLPEEPILVHRGATDRPWVALTVDLEYGESALRHMLAILRERNIRITFFVLGSWIEQYPDLARQIVADGHEFANHSLTHADFRKLSDDQIANELAQTDRLVFDVTGSTTRPFFRPPYGHYDDRVLLTSIRQGYLPIYWTIDSYDAVGHVKSPEELIHQITNSRSPEELHGAIILTHCCGRDSSAQALPTILDRLTEMGFEVRTLSEVLGS